MRLLGTFALLAFAAVQPALAADLPVKAPRMAPAAVAPAFTWTGVYVGGSVGYAWGNKGWTDPLGPPFDAGTHSPRGWMGGGQIGANYQMGAWVVGVEGQYDWGRLQASHISLVDPADLLGTQVNWVASVAGRVGYAFDHFLVYGKAGGAWVRDDHTKIDTGLLEGLASVTRSGWLVGGGVEYALWNNWSVRLDYSYMGFGTQRVMLANPLDGVPAPFDIKQNLQTLMVGLNYKFGPGLF